MSDNRNTSVSLPPSLSRMKSTPVKELTVASSPVVSSAEDDETVVQDVLNQIHKSSSSQTQNTENVSKPSIIPAYDNALREALQPHIPPVQNHTSPYLDALLASANKTDSQSNSSITTDKNTLKAILSSPSVSRDLRMSAFIIAAVIGAEYVPVYDILYRIIPSLNGKFNGPFQRLLVRGIVVSVLVIVLQRALS